MTDGYMGGDEPAATKHDTGKAELHLLPGAALGEVTRVLEFGAKKYGPHNWRSGMNWSRLLSATLRHIFAYTGGEKTDPESGLSHLAHAACNLLFLLEYAVKGLGDDDTYKT